MSLILRVLLDLAAIAFIFACIAAWILLLT